jgi:hypothetical protein
MHQDAADKKENVGGGEVPPHLIEKQHEENNDAQQVKQPRVPRNILQASVLALEQHWTAPDIIISLTGWRVGHFFTLRSTACSNFPEMLTP